MFNVIVVIHLILAVAMIGIVLLQRSEGGGLGIGGGGGGGMAGFLSGRGTASLLTRATAILAAAFMVTSLSLTMLASRGTEPGSLLDDLPASVPVEEPQGPSVPLQ